MSQQSKQVKFQAQEARRKLHRHTIIKFLKARDKKKTLKANRIKEKK